MTETLSPTSTPQPEANGTQLAASQPPESDRTAGQIMREAAQLRLAHILGPLDTLLRRRAGETEE